jgi:hypothetical protein
MDIGPAGGPLATGMIITAACYTAGFLTSFLLALAVTVVFFSLRNRAVKKVIIHRLNVVMNSVFASV